MLQTADELARRIGPEGIAERRLNLARDDEKFQAFMAYYVPPNCDPLTFHRARSPASAGFSLGRRGERYKVATDDVPDICRRRLPGAS
jgi:hypothetical protein